MQEDTRLLWLVCVVQDVDLLSSIAIILFFLHVFGSIVVLNDLTG